MADLEATVRLGARVDPSLDRGFRRGETAVKRLDNRLDGLKIPRGLTAGADRTARGFDRLDDSGRRAARGIGATRNELGRFRRQASGASTEVGRLQRGLGGLRGGGGIGLGIAGVGGLLAARRQLARAMERELAEIRLRTVVVTEGDRGEAAARLRADARELARSREASLATEADLVESFYQASSAGLTEALARDAGIVSHRVARVTTGNIEQVTATIARSLNLFGDQVGGRIEQRAERIGDILTTVQQAEQISNFGALGEGLQAGAASALSAGLRFADFVAIIGRLNSLGLLGSQSGTSLQALLAELPRAADKLEADIVRGDDGALDFLATLRNIKRTVEGLDPDAAVLKLQKGFGQEAVRAFNLLAGSIDDLEPALERASGSFGRTRRDYEEFADSVAGRSERAKQNVSALADTATNVLLPAFGDLAGPLGDHVADLDAVVDRSPVAADVIRGLTGAVIALGAATLAAKGLGVLGAILGAAPAAAIGVGVAGGIVLRGPIQRQLDARSARGEREFERLARETTAAFEGPPSRRPVTLNRALLPRVDEEFDEFSRLRPGSGSGTLAALGARRGPLADLALETTAAIEGPPSRRPAPGDEESRPRPAAAVDARRGPLADLALAIEGPPSRRPAPGDEESRPRPATGDEESRPRPAPADEFSGLRPGSGSGAPAALDARRGPLAEAVIVERGAIQVIGAGSPRETAEEVIRRLEERAQRRTASAEWDER